MTQPLNRLAPHQPPAATNKYGPCLLKDTKEPPPLNSRPPWEPPPCTSHKTSWSGLSLGPQLHQGVHPQSPSPPRPQLARCVYFRWANIATCLRVQWPVLFRGGGGCVLRWVHVASHSNGCTGWVRGILQAQLESANQTYLCCSSAFSQTGEPLPAFISFFFCLCNKITTWRPYKSPLRQLWPFTLRSSLPQFTSDSPNNCTNVMSQTIEKKINILRRWKLILLMTCYEVDSFVSNTHMPR